MRAFLAHSKQEVKHISLNLLHWGLPLQILLHAC